MDDSSPMPFGKYKGEKLANIPAQYLVWLESKIREIAYNKRTLNQKEVMKFLESKKKL